MKRVVSGTRPTGKLHIGHLLGILENWKKLQDEYETFYFIADIHSFTNDLSTDKKEFYYDIVKDILAAGVDPERSTIFVQSEVPQHGELSTLLSMVTPLSWLERCPTFKDAVKNIKNKEKISLGLVSYPVLMTADIIIYDASYVPVGKDQLPHLEISREIVRRFNRLFGETFVEPQPLLTKYPLLLGYDNRKMSKSYNNCIYLSETEESLRKKIFKMITDPEKVRKNDPGHPKICNVFTYHGIFGTKDLDSISKRCQSGELGCVECKKYLYEDILNVLLKHQKRKKDYSNEQIREILDRGKNKAEKIAQEKLNNVKNNMGMVI
ncbi:tryptophan--tRNA ligase [bacterium]|nr:tryptophan--tRNA ligase [bacterium]